MVNLKDVSSGESGRTSGSTGETAVLYMGSGWDIHPEGNLRKETIGNKAKSFQRHQRAVLCTWAVELGCSPGFSIYSEYNSPSFKVNPPHKGEREMGLELRWDLWPPLHRKSAATVLLTFLSLCMYLFPRPRAWLLQVIWLPGYYAWGLTVAYVRTQEDDDGGDDDMMTRIEARLGLSLTMHQFKSHIYIYFFFLFFLFNTPINPRRQALSPSPPSTWRSWDREAK